MLHADITRPEGGSPSAHAGAMTGRCPLASPLLELSELSVRFQGSEARAVEGIDLHVGRGEVLALVGGSGSGKSVTAKSIIGLLMAERKWRDGALW